MKTYLQSTLIFVRLQIYFTLPRKTTLLNLKQKLKPMNNCTVSKCFNKFLSNCFIESICVFFSVAILSIIFKVQDQKHGRKTQGVMSGIVAAI